MDEDNVSTFQTPETTKKDDSYNPRSDSTAMASKSKEKEIPRYLRASTGSCHDICKYGKREIPMEKPWRSTTKKIFKKGFDNNLNEIWKAGSSIMKKVSNDSSEIIKREVLSSDETHVKKKNMMVRPSPSSQDSGSRSSGSVDGLNLKAPKAIKKSNSALGTSKSKVSHEKIASSSPVLKSKIGFKNEDPKLKKDIVSSRVVSKKAPVTPRSSISPRVPVKLAGISSLKKSQNLKAASSQSLKEASKQSLKTATSQSLKAASKPNLKAASSQSLNASSPSRQSLKDTTSQSVKAASKQSLKTASKPNLKAASSQSLNATSSQNLNATSIPLRQSLEDTTSQSLHASSSDSQPDQTPRHVDFIDESNQSDRYPVEEKTLHVVETETTNKVPEQEENHQCVLEQSPQKEDESTVSESEDYEYISGSNESEEKRPRTRNEIEDETPEEAARKLSFRRGKVVNPETVNDTTRKLKFRKGRELGEEDRAKEERRRRFKKREEVEEGEEEDENGEKVVLRHQDVQEKDAQGLFNNVIEETASKLVEARKSKVKALVGAFETVISLQEAKPAAAGSSETG